MKDLLFHRKLIFFWGIILTSLILISSISLNIVQFLPGIIIMFLSYFSFYLGSRIKTYDFHKLSCEYWILKKINTKLSFGISIGFLIFTLFYIRYYTGQTPANVLLNLVLKNSNYELYQKFFLENEMSSFSL
jgi:hypothetical protein